MKNITNANQLICNAKNMENFSGNHTSKRTYKLRLPGMFRTISLDGSGSRYKNFRVLNLNVFWIISPEKKLG